jgi:L-asparaginase
MHDFTSRRRVLKNMAAFGAAGTVSNALASAPQHSQQIAQAQLGPQAPAPEPSGALPRIQLMIGPGTLPSVGKDRMDLLRYRVSGIPRLSGQQLLEPLPEISKIARVEVDKGNPWEMATYDDLRKLSMRVGELLRSPDVDGVVWVQGTNTIEETAYFLSLTVQSDKPIVVTGAQRPYNGLSTDGPMNLLDAVRLACSPEARGKGAIVAFNGEINAARDVTKTNTYHLQTFRTRDLGLLGYIDPDRIEFYRTPHRRHTVKSEFSLEGVQSIPYVDVLYVHTGTRPGLAQALVGLGAKGIVIASVGAGSPGNLDKEIGEILKTGAPLWFRAPGLAKGA